MFYINYVVCKSRFNTSKAKSCCSFYINYVVCKSKVDLIRLNCCKSFILTMWYVNDKDKYVIMDLVF